MEQLLIAYAQGVGFVAIVLAWMWVAKQVSDRRIASRYAPDEEIESRANVAVGLRRAGLYLGLAIGMLGALDGGGGTFLESVVELLVDGLALSVGLLIAQQITDRVVIPGIRTDEAVKDGNVAVGAVEFGIFVATGLVANGSFSGEGGGLASALVFFVLGQLALLCIVRLYELRTAYSIIEAVRSGNAAAGIMLAGMLLALGFILRASIAGPFQGWTQDLTAFALSVTFGTIVLMLLQAPIDRLFLPGTTLRRAIDEDRNVAAVGVAAAIKVALGLIIATVVI